jgi:nitroimidazol reductase NimA-like FMN-containing flavoprotein (pyridoxamine 5'-phosphate oxidase superfamily)
VVQPLPERDSPPPSPRTRVKRRPQRGRYDRATRDAILDEALVCHVGFVHQGAPSVIPTAFVRWDDAVYLHGSPANRAFLAVASGAEVCVEATLVDAVVLARSAFHTSMNYRSVVVYGRGRAVQDPPEKEEALRRLVEKVCPGRWADVRWPSAEELAGTLVVAVPLLEASAKVRAEGPVDDEADHALDCWAGQLPLRLLPGEPVDDALLRAGIPRPGYLKSWRR